MSKLTFEEWKEQINTFVKSEIKLDVDELPDMPYRVWYDNDNLTPKEVSYIIIGDFYKNADIEVSFCKEYILENKDKIQNRQIQNRQS